MKTRWNTMDEFDKHNAGANLSWSALCATIATALATAGFAIDAFLGDHLIAQIVSVALFCIAISAIPAIVEGLVDAAKILRGSR